MSLFKGALHLAALADADPNADGDLCGARGPDGDCCRVRGHYDDDVWNLTKHVSYDTGHYRDWPVGWKSTEQKVAAVNDPHFASALVGNLDFQRGVEECLRLVRATLR